MPAPIRRSPVPRGGGGLLGPIATPSDVELRTSLPKTRSGKIMRRYPKAVEMGQDPGDVSTMAD